MAFSMLMIPFGVLLLIAAALVWFLAKKNIPAIILFILGLGDLCLAFRITSYNVCYTKLLRLWRLNIHAFNDLA